MKPGSVLLGALVVVAGAAGCGGSGHDAATTTVALPRSLAQAWASRADAIAAASAAGHGCQAQRLAGLLRDDVVGADARVPPAFRTPLLTSVNELADRIACIPPTRTVTMPAHEPPNPPHHGDHPKRAEHGPKGH